MQPVTGSHVSSVQGLLSSQLSGVPGSQLPVAGLHCSRPSQTVPLPALHATAAGVSVPAQTPPAQTSFCVHALLSSHGFVFGTLKQPSIESHESSVQGLLSLQLSGVPATHPVAGSHVAIPSQTLPFSQTTGTPAHTPARHVSPVVHALPSLQGFVFGTLKHPSAESHESSVQGLLSLQLS